MLAIYKKEIKNYFTSMIGFVFLAFFLVLVGIFYMTINLSSQVANFAYVLDSVSLMFILVVPILTMRIMAEENRQKTDQLLYTSPISVERIVIGKFLAVLSLFAIAMLVISAYPLLLTPYGEMDLVLSFSSILGFFLMGAAYLSIGLFISSLTESQVIAAVASFVAMLFSYLMTAFAGMLPQDNLSVFLITDFLVLLLCVVAYLMMHNLYVAIGVGVVGIGAFTSVYFLQPSFYDGFLINVLGWFSVSDRFASFQLGMLSGDTLIYYVSVTFIFLFLTVIRIKKVRWN